MNKNQERVTCYLCDGFGRIGNDILCWVCSDGTVTRAKFEKHKRDIAKMFNDVTKTKKETKKTKQPKKKKEPKKSSVMGNKPRILDLE